MLIAAFLTPVEQTRVIPWLYTVVRTLRRFQTSVTIETKVQNAGFLTSADKPGACPEVCPAFKLGAYGMDQKRDLRRLFRHSSVVGFASLAVVLFGIISLLLYLNPTIVGVSSENGLAYQGNWIWLFVSMTFMIVGMAFFLIAGWWSRRLKWILRSQKASLMRLSLEVNEDSDSTSYYALLQSPDVTSGRNEWRASIWLKPASVKGEIGKQFDAQVYFDPRSGKPAIIEYEKGILWIMAGAGSVLKLS